MSLSRAVDTSECARYAIKEVEGISRDTRMDSGSGVMRRYDISSANIPTSKKNVQLLERLL